MIKRLIARPLTGLATVAVAVGLAVGAAALPAHAVVVHTSHPKITAQHLDFGTNYTLGAPLNGGDLDWDVAGGLTTPRLTGKLYINNDAGTCARMRLKSYDENHVWINTRNGGTVCASDGSLHTWNVDFAAPGDPDTTHVHVILQVQNTNGTYSNVGTAYTYLS